jgi:deazaflavin-dependent oxidoreductase (nitroreductase family)
MDFIDAAGKTNEVTLTTTGRKTGKRHAVTVWITTDGKRVYIRSGQGLRRDWPQNLLANPNATVRAANDTFNVAARHVTDPAEARATTELVASKYGMRTSSAKAEQAVFELTPA